MNFSDEPLYKVGDIDVDILKVISNYIIDNKLLNDSSKLNYKTTTILNNDQEVPWWCRIDGSLRQGTLYTHEQYNLIKPAIDSFFKLNLPTVNGRILCAWSLSRLNPKTRLTDHTDGILRFRFSDRYIIPLSMNEKSYNYYKNGDNIVKTYFKLGSVYRLNNLVIHGAVNDGDVARDNILLDVIESRIWEKYKNHQDIYSLISPRSSKIDNEFFKNLLQGEVRAYKGIKNVL